MTISPDATLQDALDLMIAHDFTQLPVVEDGRLFGRPATLVTSHSIARAVGVFKTTLGNLRVRDAVVNARTIAVDEDLFTKMDDLLEDYAVLVLNPDGTLAGVVTNYDTTQYFRRRAEDLLLVEDVETTLKDHIRVAYGENEGGESEKLQAVVGALTTPIDGIRNSCRKAFRKFCAINGIQPTDIDVVECIDQQFATTRIARTFDELSLSEYIQVARRPEAWNVLGPVFGISDAAFREMLEAVRRTRNKLMHFRPDIGSADRDALRFCAEWFKHHPPLTPADELADGVPVNSPVSDPLTGPDTSPESLDYLTDSVTDEGPGYADASVVRSKYAPLAAHLSHQPRSRERVSLTFKEIEEIIRASLPAAAREHRAWWANDATAHVQSAQWLEANWRVASINMTKERVEFARARDRERAYINFFSSVQAKLRGVTDFPLSAASPLGQNWLPLVNYSGTGCTLVLSFARRQRVRLECYIDTGDAVQNDFMFERLHGLKSLIESVIGCDVAWERLMNRRACRFALYRGGTITDKTERLNELAEWTLQTAPRFHQGVLAALTEMTKAVELPR